MAGRGGPSKLTPELQEKICSFICKGSYIVRACEAAGITQKTYDNWLKWGEERNSGIYFDFYQAVKKAEADAEQHCVDIIEGAAVGPVVTRKTVTKPDGVEVTETVQPGNWQAAAWLLERVTRLRLAPG